MKQLYRGISHLRTEEWGVFGKSTTPFIKHRKHFPFTRAYAGYEGNYKPVNHFIGEVEDYYLGRTEPNYPVPAIRQGFEFGRSLPSGIIILLHWQQEAVNG